MSESAHKRLITEMVILAKRLGKLDGKKASITISEKELAALTGLTRETVSREIKALRNKNILEFKKSTLTIFDTEQLGQLL